MQVLFGGVGADSSHEDPVGDEGPVLGSGDGRYAARGSAVAARGGGRRRRLHTRRGLRRKQTSYWASDLGNLQRGFRSFIENGVLFDTFNDCFRATKFVFDLLGRGIFFPDGPINAICCLTHVYRL